jgi:hypothetical protein
MRDQRTTILWMKDLIDHLARCHEQLEGAGDGSSVQFLAEAMLVDLSECRRLCEHLRRRQHREALCATA